MEGLYILLVATAASCYKWNSESFAQVNAVIEKVMACENIPALQLSIVVKSNEPKILMEKTYGFADIHKKESATNRHVFCLGSISKSLNALLVQQTLNKIG